MVPALAVFHLVSTGVQELSAADCKRCGPGGIHVQGVWKKRVRTGARGLHLKYATGAIVDKFICPGVDLDAYSANCRAPLFPDMWNTWRLYRASDPSVDPSVYADKALAFMTWLNNTQLEGKIRQLTVEANNVRAGVKQTGALVTTPAILTRQTVCDVAPQLKAVQMAPAYQSITARFVYRGQEGGTPWPAYKVTAAVVQRLCPTDAVWLLDTVYAPDQRKVPDPSTDTTLPPYYAAHTPSPGDLSFGTKIVIGGGALLALGLALAYVVRSFK